MGAGKPKGDGTKSQLVENDRSTWTWENLSTWASTNRPIAGTKQRSGIFKQRSSNSIPELDVDELTQNLLQLAKLQPFAGVSLFFRGFW